MMSALVKFSIRYSGAVIGLCTLMVFYGLYVLSHSNLDVFPEFSPNQLVIQTESPGLSAELVETLVSQPIESSIGGAIGVKNIRSQSIPGLSIVTVIFNENTDIYRNRQVVSERLSTLSNRMPPGVVPNITPLTSSASTILGFGLTSTARNLTEIRTLVDFTIVPHLMGVPGVADVNVFGGKVRELQISVLPEKMIEYGISILDIENAVNKATGIRANGFLENENQRIVINTEGQTTTPQQLGKATLRHHQGHTIRLDNIANVIEGAQPSISSASINGVTGVYLSVQGQLGANAHALTRDIEKALEELKPMLHNEAITLHEGLFRPDNFINVAIEGVQTDIIIGSILVIAILFLFLFNFRTAVISATAIPLSLLSAIVVLNYYGVGLNIMVLGGLAIALGEVVDDAIIDAENIFRRLRENRLLDNPDPVYKVIYDASMEVRNSVVYATLIVVIVFLPLLTLSGVSGKLFAPLGMAYITAILASLVVALTLTPALCTLLLTSANLDTEDSPVIRSLKGWYENVLTSIERFHLPVLISSILIIGLGLATLPLFKSHFIPPLHEGHFIMHMTAVPGTSEKMSLKLGNKVSAAIREIDGVKSVTQWVGRAPNGADTFGTHYSEFEIEIGAISGEEQRRILSSIREKITGGFDDDDDDGPDEEDEDEAREEDDGEHEESASFVGVNFAINTFLTERIEETISGYAASIVVNIYGTNLGTLDQDAYKVVNILRSMPGATDIQVQSPPGTPQLVIRLRQDKLTQWGLQATDVLDTVRAAYGSLPVTQVYEGNRVTPVTVLLDLDARDDVQDAPNIPLFNPEGKRLRLKDVAYLTQENGRSKILHGNGKRIQTVTANVEDRSIDSFNTELRKNIKDNLQLSQGSYLEITGEAEANQSSRESLIMHAALAIVGVFIMLYITFGRLRNLLLTFLNLPFALIGGVAAAMLTGGWISIGSLVGFVTLFGITLRNSIMMVSHFQHLIDYEGYEWNLQTCIKGASERLPSILMTALVTSLGLLPLAAGSGEPGREIEGPMATIIVGGLFTSTILNLLILPTIMLHFGKFQRQLKSFE